jgi:hypothetical protein
VIAPPSCRSGNGDDLGREAQPRRIVERRIIRCIRCLLRLSRQEESKRPSTAATPVTSTPQCAFSALELWLNCVMESVGEQDSLAEQVGVGLREWPGHRTFASACRKSAVWAARWPSIRQLGVRRDSEHALDTYTDHRVPRTRASAKPSARSLGPASRTSHRERFLARWRCTLGEQVEFPPLPGDRDPSSGDTLPDLPPDRCLPAGQPQRRPDRALPPLPS